MIYDVIIIGAGAAGLFAAANIKNKKILIIEKNKAPGKKLLLSGAGQCNYTNNCSIDEFLQCYGDKGRFIRTALYNFSNYDTMNFFSENGLKSTIREDNKVFPNTFKAEDVLKVLTDSSKHTEIILNSPVEKVAYNLENKLFYIKINSSSYACHNLIIATGGKSYPITGSTGDGYKFAEYLGHEIVMPRPALTPIYVKNYQFKELSGISFKDIKIVLYKNKRKSKEFIGDMLFTHANISGPAVINNSRYMDEGDIIKINFTEIHNEEEFKLFFEKLISTSKSNIISTLKELNLPRRFLEKILNLCNISEDLSCSQLSRNQRKTLIQKFSSYEFQIDKLGDYNIAMVTKGGVSTNEVNHKTMESKKIPRLYFAGEVLDFDGDTGGFNIQGAFSTAKLAADQVNKT